MFLGNLRLKSRNSRELINCPASMSKPPAGHFGHNHSQTCNNRNNDQGGFIPHPSCAVFVHRPLMQCLPIQHIAGTRHFLRENRSFFWRHSLKINCHQHGGYLIIRDAAINAATDKIGQFLLIQLFSIALFK